MLSQIQMYSYGKAYYDSENVEITKRRKTIAAPQGIINHPYASNVKIASSFYKTLVDQKVNYLLGIKPLLPEKLSSSQMYRAIKKAAKKASTYGIQWVYPYIKNGQIGLQFIPTSELLPQYDEQGNLSSMTRSVNINGTSYLYIYDTEKVRVYEGDGENAKFIKEEGHLVETITQGTIETKRNLSWGKVPFIALHNNEDDIYDLQPVKPLIDAYDLTISDFCNNLLDFQEIYWVIKNYDGENLSELINNINTFKAVNVSDDGGAEAITMDVPHEARNILLDKLEGLIYKFGGGLNIDRLSGGSLTNEVIKAHFANLDMRANDFSEFVTDFILEVADFYNRYVSLVGGELIENTDVVYSKSLIVNEIDILASVTNQLGTVSVETALKNHPWVDNVADELERISKEKGNLGVTVQTE